MSEDQQAPNDELRPECNASQLQRGVRGKYLEVAVRESRFGSVPTPIMAVAIALFLGLLSWVTLLPGWPRIWAPCNILAFLPALVFCDLFHSPTICLTLTAMVIPLFFLLWTAPATWCAAKPPTRTIVLSLLMVLLSAASVILGFSYGVEYQGWGYVIGVVIISVIFWVAILALAVIAVRSKRVKWNVAFHIVFFAWLAWYAIPYMGELP